MTRFVTVVVENIEPEAEHDGLTKRQVQTDVELRLRQAGIRVLSREEIFGFLEESEKFCTPDEISLEKSLLVGALTKRRIDETQEKAFLNPRNVS